MDYREYIAKTDTVVKVAPDTAMARALFECDSLGNILMLELLTLQGQRVAVAPQIKYVSVPTLNGGVRRQAYIDLLAVCDSMSMNILAYENLVESLSRKVQVQEETIKNKPPSMQIFLIGLVLGAVITLIISLSIYSKRIS